MEESRSIPIGLVVGLPLIAMALVTGSTYLLTGSRKAERAPATAARESVGSPEPAPVDPASRVRSTTVGSPPRVATVGSPPRAPAAPPVLSAARPGTDPRAAGAFQDPKIRQHARLVFVENARHAMTQRNVERLRQLREMLRQGELAQTIAPADLQAIDLGLDCLVHADGFRQRADDFLEDNPSAELAESLRGICR